MTKTVDSRFRGNDKLFVRAVGVTFAAFFRLGDHGGSPLHWGGFLIDYLRLIIEI